ncbi:MAG: hypothetical protein Q7R33_00775 [Nitrosarchaeum sp.]|nr:hypothetical protein [Nitrosarchaeum sp.]
MVLTGLEIVRQMDLGNIFISDYDVKRLNPNSYNLRLHNILKVYKNRELDLKLKNEVVDIVIPEEGYVIQPNEIYLGRTMEMTKTVGFVPQIEGRSSIGRLGIDVHKTAGWGDDGFENFWTLEIVATQPVRIYPFIEFCQIIYMMVNGDASMKYKGKYQKTNDIDGSKMYEEFKSTTK